MPEQALTEEIDAAPDGAPKREPKRSASPDLMLWADVIEYTTLSKAVIHRLMKRDEFPLPVQLAPNRVAFRRAEVEDWVSSLATAA